MASAAASSAGASSSAGSASSSIAQHTPSLAGSVLECPDGFGGTLLIRIQNMTASADLGVRLDLKQIALRCRNTEFNPRRFAAVIMRLREPRATCLLFSTGKLVVTGTKSTHNSSLATKKIAYILERIGFQPANHISFKVQNVVGTVDVGFPIRLEGVAFAHPTFSSYEPELFPGLIYRLVQPRVTILVFVSGKLSITGAKTEEIMVEGLKKIYPILLEFKKESVAVMPGVDGVPALPALQPATKGKRGRPRKGGKRGKELGQGK